MSITCVEKNYDTKKYKELIYTQNKLIYSNNKASSVCESNILNKNLIRT